MMPKPTQQAKPQPPKRTGREILSSVPYEKGFHFYTELGKYTGITANSLSEFGEKLQKIPVESIFFHFQRDDYQKWLRGTLEDEELAQRFDQLKKWPSWSSDENLRKELVKTVQIRINELRPAP
jgi:hypothetical protein